MAYDLSQHEVHPDSVVRVGFHAARPVGHTYRLRIVEVGTQSADGRVRLIGDRLTLAGRIVERLAVTVGLDDLRPDILA